MSKALIQPQQEHDGYAPPFTIIDELTQYLVDKYINTGAIERRPTEDGDTHERDSF